jgi:uncharacterized protein (DUF4415 family)
MSKRNISSSGKVSEEASGFESRTGDDEIVAFDDSFFENARVVIGGKVVRQATRPAARRGRPPKPEGERKVLVSLRLAPEILDWIRSTGPGWQSRIEELLRREMAVSGGSS